MVKEWFIDILGNEEGPFALQELESDRRITPDTLVWKEGFEDWIPAGDVKELQFLFEDDHGKPKTEIIRPFSHDLPETDDVLTLEYDPKQWFAWLLIVILVLLYALYKIL